MGVHSSFCKNKPEKTILIKNSKGDVIRVHDFPHEDRWDSIEAGEFYNTFRIIPSLVNDWLKDNFPKKFKYYLSYEYIIFSSLEETIDFLDKYLSKTDKIEQGDLAYGNVNYSRDVDKVYFNVREFFHKYPNGSIYFC
jgi:hypothetical protein